MANILMMKKTLTKQNALRISTSFIVVFFGVSVVLGALVSIGILLGVVFYITLVEQNRFNNTIFVFLKCLIHYSI
ncbi:hypothetical protein A1QO_03895 [Vibrio genomosp. F10 str. ZF-129]|uniref:Uncharacterized protein n=1 Tax=Vibrio genomosp. F10 str. ZF-129 TaxID=1187848 RepID=A0A1E5BII1_9VIBR|nr:hypothetical protein A1QO_03895 [Vibrio genomosp. F10 str. ZF-129]